jgi:hypothetical protein
LFNVTAWARVPPTCSSPSVSVAGSTSNVAPEAAIVTGWTSAFTVSVSAVPPPDGVNTKLSLDAPGWLPGSKPIAPAAPVAPEARPATAEKPVLPNASALSVAAKLPPSRSAGALAALRTNMSAVSGWSICNSVPKSST